MNDPQLLSWLFGQPDEAERFFNEHWLRQPYVLHRDQPGFFDGLIERRDIDELVNGRNARYPEVSMAQAGRRLAPERYAARRVVKDVALHCIEPQAVASLFAEGASLLLRAVHTGLPRVMALSRRLEALLRQPLTCTCYVTPPASASLPRHADPGATLVLQVAGTKHWMINADSASQAQSTRLVTLTPGSMLYLPPAWPHFVTSADAVAISLNFSVEAPTVRQLLREAVDEMLDDAAFDAVADAGDLAAMGALRERLVRQAASLRDEDLLRLLVRDFEQRRLPARDAFGLPGE